MTYNLDVGARGEHIVKTYLIQKGYCFIYENFRTKSGEIDLIFRDRSALVFVEVKTRRSVTFGYPEESITKTKIQSITKTLHEFRKIYPEYKKYTYRIDAVAVLYKEDSEFSPEITHISHIG